MNRRTWVYWLPVAGCVTLMVASWLINSRLQFMGDFLIPTNPSLYVQRLSQSWDPSPDLGCPSLLTVVAIPPRAILDIFYDLVFLASGGSLVAVEFSFVLITLLLASSGMFVLYKTLGQGERSHVGLLTSSFVYVVNPYVLFYLQNPVAILPYCVIPWCLAFTIRGLKGKNVAKNAILLGLSYSLSLATFPQVAISAVIAVLVTLLFAYYYWRLPHFHLSQFKF